MNDANHLMTVFSTALDFASGSERVAYVDRACAGDPELRAGVEALLRAHDEAGRFLEPRPEHLRPTPSPHDPSAATLVPGPNPAAGTVVGGRYRLEEEIGAGGMGTVWRAEQTEPVRREVALKLIKSGMDTRQVVARFEAERQALALMDHPNIARVFDGGTTAEGRPYFVMELVRGVPVTAFCDRAQLPLRERLELFVGVCHAVQHAHQKGVIHRDLKPSNVLVTRYEGRPVPKVIDFGIAKATSQPLTDQSLFSGLAGVAGTPEYMSPEQAALANGDIDTRSDVYSLGVLLYELLTGTTPLTGRRSKETPLLEVLRWVREEEPPNPSTRLSALENIAVVATNRGLEPRRLIRLIRGDLDWIVMKALEKDRTRRYETVATLAADVRDHLAGEPVLAVPPTRGYRLRKFVRRNRGVVAGVAIVGVAVLIAVGGVAGSIGWATRDREAQAAEVERELERELRQTARLRDQGDRAGARAAVKRVEWLLHSGDRGNQREQLAQVVKDLDMIDRLEEIGLSPPVVPNHPGQNLARALLAKDYAAAFREYGIDVPTLNPATAAQCINASPIRIQLAAALDDWMWSELCTMRYARMWISEPKPTAKYEHLRAVADLAVPNEVTRQIRGCTARSDKQTLTEIAARPEVASLRSSNVLLLARLLDYTGAADKAIDVMCALHQREPGNVIVNLEIAFLLLQSVKPARPDVAIGFLRAARAARPDLDALRRSLNSALALRGKALALRGKELVAKRDWSGAVAAYSEAIELGGASAEVWYDRGASYARLGRWAEAAGDLPKAVALKPDDGQARFVLSASLLLAGDKEGYRKACHDNLQRLVDGKASYSAYLTCRACGLAPDAVPDPTVPVRQMERYVAANRNARSLHALALAYYRAGDYDNAITRLEESKGMDSSWDERTCVNGFVLAMTYHRLERSEKARDRLNATVARLERGERAVRAPETFPAELLEWLSCQILRCEAETLIAAVGK